MPSGYMRETLFGPTQTNPRFNSSILSVQGIHMPQLLWPTKASKPRDG